MTSHTASSVTLTRVIAVAFIAIAAGTPAAFSQTYMMKEGEIQKVTVNYSDLNLSTEAGSRTLYGRVLVAARQVCPQGSHTLSDLRWNLDVQRCITDSVERAVKEIKNPKFAEVAESSSAVLR